MHESDNVLENETHKFLWDFEVLTDHLSSARRSNLMISHTEWKIGE